ncbi:MAG: endonuclease/exonuclease/phosphatase family protein [Proteobacteria bacterium]|nr:endonuclease/exonuclease/phosphatase family protein [Pseudomonadota bacterium]MBS0494546.1 endonuclease/exonuclease/phosphatase family protein [Pseudomonadota bacterium]
MMRGLAAPIARRAVIVAWLCGLGALTTFAPYLPEPLAPATLRWLAGLASHWQWAYAGFALFSAALVIGLRREHRWPLLVPLALVAAAWLHQAPRAETFTPTTAAQSQFTVASANLNFERTDHSALTAWLLSANAPDVIALQEFTPSALAMTNSPAILAAYPHRVLAPSDDQFGLGVLSKAPITAVEKVEPADMLATLKLRLRVNVQGHLIALTAIHPMPPINAAYAQARDASLRLEAQQLARTGMPGILLGDMKDTPWSTGLQAAAPLQRASSLAPTWPNVGGWLSVLPLDHVLVTPGVRVGDAGLGVEVGSDHRGVWVRLAL